MLTCIQFTTSLPRSSEALLDGKAEIQTPCLAVVVCCQNSLLHEIKLPEERHSTKLLARPLLQVCTRSMWTHPRSVSFLACLHAISLERSRFRKNAQLKSAAYLHIQVEKSFL